MGVTEILRAAAAPYGLTVDDGLAAKLEIYARELAAWNEKLNLTAIRDEQGVAVKHFLDCLLVTQCADFSSGTLIDVGTGAGFPGLVLAAAFPGLSVTLLDSTGKKLAAVESIAKEMGVSNVAFIHARAEDAGRLPAYRERFDFVTARAVAALPVLLEYALPFARTGGAFFAMKGAAAGEELTAAANALSVLHGEVVKEYDFTLPGGDERTVFCIKKISQISPKYPRPSAQLTKKPL